MIHVFYVPGMFGSMIDYCLRRHSTLEPKLEHYDVMFDGSMHGFKKHLLLFESASLLQALSVLKSTETVTTPMYPYRDMSLPGILQIFQNNLPNWSKDHKILIYAPNKYWAEINLLFQYHKISRGFFNKGLEVFASDSTQSNIRRWNPDYTTWRDMAKWEYREWLSLWYDHVIKDWITGHEHCGAGWLKITNQQIMEDIHHSLNNIMDFCGLRPDRSISTFLDDYRGRQQYVLDEYETIQKIIHSTLCGEKFEWAPMHVVAESMIQNHLRLQGFEIRCDGLDIFPTDSLQLKNLLNPI